MQQDIGCLQRNINGVSNDDRVGKGFIKRDLRIPIHIRSGEWFAVATLASDGSPKVTAELLIVFNVWSTTAAGRLCC